MASTDSDDDASFEPVLCSWYHSGDGPLFRKPICGEATHYVTFIKGGGSTVACEHHADERVYMGQATISLIP